MAEVVLDRISKRFGAKPAVADLSLVIEDGAFVVLLLVTHRLPERLPRFASSPDSRSRMMDAFRSPGAM